MNKKDKTAKRLYKRIEELEKKFELLANAVSEVVQDQSIQLDEIEEFLEMNE